jgi:hypothetical protein
MDNGTVGDPAGIEAIRAEGRYCRLSGGTPATEDYMRGIVQRGHLGPEWARMAAAWLEGYNEPG